MITFEKECFAFAQRIFQQLFKTKAQSEQHSGAWGLFFFFGWYRSDY